MKTRRRYTRDFKIAVVREIETGKSLAQVSRENGIHPSLIVKWKTEYFENPEKAFSGNGKTYKEQARMAELERLVGRLYAENEFFFKKSLEDLGVQDPGRERKGGAGVKYMVIKECRESGSQISVDRATQLLGVSRCGFYKWQGQSRKEPVKGEDRGVRNELQKVAVEFPAYGYIQTDNSRTQEPWLYGEPQTCAEAHERRQSPVRSEEVQAQNHRFRP